MGCSPTCLGFPTARQCFWGNACQQKSKKWIQSCNHKVPDGTERLATTLPPYSSFVNEEPCLQFNIPMYYPSPKSTIFKHFVNVYCSSKLPLTVLTLIIARTIIVFIYPFIYCFAKFFKLLLTFYWCRIIPLHFYSASEKQIPVSIIK